MTQDRVALIRDPATAAVRLRCTDGNLAQRVQTACLSRASCPLAGLTRGACLRRHSAVAVAVVNQPRHAGTHSHRGDDCVCTTTLHELLLLLVSNACRPPERERDAHQERHRDALLLMQLSLWIFLSLSLFPLSRRQQRQQEGRRGRQERRRGGGRSREAGGSAPASTLVSRLAIHDQIWAKEAGTSGRRGREDRLKEKERSGCSDRQLQPSSLAPFLPSPPVDDDTSLSLVLLTLFSSSL